MSHRADKSEFYANENLSKYVYRREDFREHGRFEAPKSLFWGLMRAIFCCILAIWTVKVLVW